MLNDKKGRSAPTLSGVTLVAVLFVYFGVDMNSAGLYTEYISGHMSAD